jgi:DNA-binding response OmpR family regulator
MNANARRPKVLMVDDNAELLAVVSRYLTKRGVDVITTESPIGVRALMLKHAPQVVVLDVMMPALDGGRLAQLIRESSVSVASVIFFSASPDEDLHKMTVKCPGTTYVSKSEGPQVLFAAVCAAIRGAA